MVFGWGCEVAHALMMHLSSQCGPSYWDPYLSLKMLYTFCWMSTLLTSPRYSLNLLKPFCSVYTKFEPLCNVIHMAHLNKSIYYPGLCHFITEHHGIQSTQIAVSSTIRLIQLSSTITNSTNNSGLRMDPWEALKLTHRPTPYGHCSIPPFFDR